MTHYKFEQLQDLAVQMDCLQNIWENIQMNVEETNEVSKDVKQNQDSEYDSVNVIKQNKNINNAFKEEDENS